MARSQGQVWNGSSDVDFTTTPTDMWNKTTLTVAQWIRPTATPGATAGLIDGHYTANGEGIQCRILTSNKVDCGFVNNYNQSTPLSTSTATNDVWSHWAVTLGSTGTGVVKLYFNGAYEQVQTNANVTNTGDTHQDSCDMHIGAYEGGGNRFTGHTAYTCAYTGVLTDDELAALATHHPELVARDRLVFLYEGDRDVIGGYSPTLSGSRSFTDGPPVWMPHAVIWNITSSAVVPAITDVGGDDILEVDNTTVTITGTGFTGATSVTIDDGTTTVTQDGFSVTDDTSIDFTFTRSDGTDQLPTSAAGRTLTVTVTGPGGTDTHVITLNTESTWEDEQVVSADTSDASLLSLLPGGTTPADGDTMEWETNSSAVTVAANGVVTCTSLPQTFDWRFWDASENELSSTGTVTVTEAGLNAGTAALVNGLVYDLTSDLVTEIAQ